jgi:hypothetical protein
MRSKGLKALALSAVMIGLVPASALAAKPGATTGGAANITFSSVRFNGSVDANREATTYYFQYGPTIAFGAQSTPTPVGGGANPVRVSVDIGGLAPQTRYFYRIVANNNSGTTLGKRRSFTTKRQPLGVTLTASPNPVKASSSATTLSGTLTGTGNAGRKVVLQSSVFPFSGGFVNASNEQVTSATGAFSFPILSVPFNTQYRVQMPERPAVISPIVTVGVTPRLTTHVGKHRVQRGKTIAFWGSVKPFGSRQQIAFQKKRNGSWVTVGGTNVRSHGGYKKRLKIRRGGTFRVWTGDVAGQYASTAGRSVKIRSFR